MMASIKSIIQTFNVTPEIASVLIARFNSKIDKNTSECWIWLGTKSTKKRGESYGRIEVCRNKKRRLFPVHRLSYAIHNGSVSQKILVCHKCDNPLCVNPEHLFLGTNQDNVNDMISKKRNSPPPILSGILNPKATLTDNQISEIRKTSGPQRALAIRYGVSQSTIWRLRNKKTRYEKRT